jgi:hypothetical protein
MTGGIIDVVKTSGRQEYFALKKNSISSEAFVGKSPGSFLVQKYIPACPIDDFPRWKKKLGLFLEVK